MINDPQAIADILKSPQYDTLLLQKGGYKHIDRNLLRICSEAVRDLELKFGWDDYNRQRHAGRFLDGESLIKGPSLPAVPRPFHSWAEFRMSVFGGMQDMPFEQIEVEYTVTKKHRSDWHDSLNNRIWYQGKGVIANSDAARDLICAAKQNSIHHVFIFTVPNIKCPWPKPRKDGSVMTQEEWCKKEGFDYIYEGEEQAFLQSPRRKWLVENFAKNLPPLPLNNACVLEDLISINLKSFAHKQQQQRATIN
ncbi:hypothetical protein [Pseudomonas fortuita]|uniref:hypothetical protein n=1 Tax=Pseudomonas fortuita TaxID=3233375 RepID=UPI003C2D158A